MLFTYYFIINYSTYYLYFSFLVYLYLICTVFMGGQAEELRDNCPNKKRCPLRIWAAH
jgi:hypothetical protein